MTRPGVFGFPTQTLRENASASNSTCLIGEDQTVKVKGDASFTVEGKRQEKVSKNYALDAGVEIHLKAGMNVVLESGTAITLKAGDNFIDISPAGVFIMGKMVMINSGGVAGSGRGSDPDDAEYPVPTGDPTKPTPADDARTGFKSCPS